MNYQVTKQFGCIKYTNTFQKTFPVANTLSATFETNLGNNFGVSKHDDVFLPGDGVGSRPEPFYNAGQSFVTVEEIDLRNLYSDGMVLDDLRINLQRAWDAPRITTMYNQSPDADIWESIIITTDPYPVAEKDTELKPFEWHLTGFRPMQDNTTGTTTYNGMGAPESTIFVNTRIYTHDQARVYSGSEYTSYSDDETLYPTKLYTDFITVSDLVRGYPDLISAPTLYVYRVVTSWYYLRSLTFLSLEAQNNQTAQLQCHFTPMQITVSGNVRKGTESERIMKATDSLLQRPNRPNATR